MFHSESLFKVDINMAEYIWISEVLKLVNQSKGGVAFEGSHLRFM